MNNTRVLSGCWRANRERRDPCNTCRMNTTSATPYKGHRFPHEIIGHTVWLYYRFSLSYRDVEELLAERGVAVTCETVRQWCLKFGQAYANQLPRRRAKPGDKWHLDEVFLKINGKTSYLWRAVDQHGNVLDILVQSRRNKAAAKKFFRKLLKRCEYVPRVLMTDKLGSYKTAKKEVMPSVEHRKHKRLNNRAENSHQPTRQRERPMRCFKSPGHAQRFLSAFGPIREHFCPPRHRLRANEYRRERARRFETWNEVISLQIAA
jgi:putative transposase